MVSESPDYLVELAVASKACHEHAQVCRQCAMPIIDDEGNPGYLSEACPEGQKILEKYMQIENAMINFSEEDHSDDICPACGDPDCSQPWNHEIEED